jgi:hypothetical protein
MARFHSSQCSWHCDQYEHECDCGVSRPSTAAWAERELMAADDGVDRAKDRAAAIRNTTDTESGS